MGESSTTTEVNVPPPTATELALQSKQLELAELQVGAIKSLTETQQAQVALTQPLFELSTEYLTGVLNDINSPESKAQAKKISDLNAELLQLNVDNIKRGGAATPEQLQYINEQTNLGIEAGSSDIEAAVKRSLGLVRDELAPARGLRPTDTPIRQVGADIAEEGLRQQGQLIRNLRAAEASAALNFPLAVSQLTGGLSATQQQLAAAANQFQQGFNLSALQVPGAYQNVAANLGLGLATGTGANPGALAAGLGNQRVGSASTTTTQSRGFFDSLAGFGALAGGAGGLLTGIDAVSSREAKFDKRPVEKGAALEALKRLPVETWRYKDDPDTVHVGTYAEDFRDNVGTGNGKTINIIDHLGVLAGAVKDLDDKLENLKRAA